MCDLGGVLADFLASNEGALAAGPPEGRDLGLPGGELGRDAEPAFGLEWEPSIVFNFHGTQQLYKLAVSLMFP